MFSRVIITEIGSLHDGSFGNACKLIEAAAACGAGTVLTRQHLAFKKSGDGMSAVRYDAVCAAFGGNRREQTG